MLALLRIQKGRSRIGEKKGTIAAEVREAGILAFLIHKPSEWLKGAPVEPCAINEALLDRINKLEAIPNDRNVVDLASRKPRG